MPLCRATGRKKSGGFLHYSENFIAVSAQSGFLHHGRRSAGKNFFGYAILRKKIYFRRYIGGDIVLGSGPMRGSPAHRKTALGMRAVGERISLSSRQDSPPAHPTLRTLIPDKSASCSAVGHIARSARPAGRNLNCAPLAVGIIIVTLVCFAVPFECRHRRFHCRLPLPILYDIAGYVSREKLAAALFFLRAQRRKNRVEVLRWMPSCLPFPVMIPSHAAGPRGLGPGHPRGLSTFS